MRFVVFILLVTPSTLIYMEICVKGGLVFLKLKRDIAVKVNMTPTSFPQPRALKVKKISASMPFATFLRHKFVNSVKAV